MNADRYLTAVLTVIALELLWIAANGLPTPVSAQTGATPVVITGIQLSTANQNLPVAVRGIVTITPEGPLKVEADRPLPVEAVPYTPTVKPGQ
jgi:hypothetical protein